MGREKEVLWSAGLDDDSLIAGSPDLIPRKLLFFSIKRIDAARRST